MHVLFFLGSRVGLKAHGDAQDTLRIRLRDQLAGSKVLPVIDGATPRDK